MKKRAKTAVKTARSKQNRAKAAGQRIICIDPGIRTCGLVDLVDGCIVHTGNYGPDSTIQYILTIHAMLEGEGRAHELIVVYEDIQYYSVRIGRHILDTTKFIGQFEYRMKAAGIAIIGVYRWQVKKWVYETFREISMTRIKQKIVRGRITRKDGQPVEAKFFFVDDRIVIAAMKECWNIPTPKPGRKSQYGLSKHSWQALATLTYVLFTQGSSA